MGPWTYYSPFWLGAILTGVLYANGYHALPEMPTWAHVGIVAVGAPLVGVLCQLLLIGAQGAFAQVLPVPRGRSIRGAAAVGGGALIILGMALSGVAVLVAVEHAGLRHIAMIIGGVGLAALLAALGLYLWNIPAAARDFSAKE